MKQGWVSVSELTRQIKTLIDQEPILQRVWVQGELSNFKKHSRGHMYFTLKDSQSRVQSVMFAGANRHLKFIPKDGMKVIIKGNISIYEPYGQYQLYVTEMQPDGIGNLYLAFEQLKEKLQLAGYFSQERKKKIPVMPKQIGIVSSPTGAAVRDMLITIKRRYPIAKVVLFPVLVQGIDAPADISKAIYQANKMDQFDVLIIGRGGGSLEELWAFNEETVAQAIMDSKVPIISAVGHETDVTISDFVADLRAPTPTAAAELAVPKITDIIDKIEEHQRRLKRSLLLLIQQERQRLTKLNQSYAFRVPDQLLKQKEQDLDRLHERLKRALTSLLDKNARKVEQMDRVIMSFSPQHRLQTEKFKKNQLQSQLIRIMENKISEHQQDFKLALSKLNLLSPLNMMDRGYSIVYNESDQLVKKQDDAPLNSSVWVHLKDSSLKCKVESHEEKKRRM